MEYITISRSNGVTKNGSPFCTLKLMNLQETVNLAVWDVAPTAGPAVGQLVRFLNIQDRQGKKSANGSDMITENFPTKQHPLYNLLPRPTEQEVWDATIAHLLTCCTDAALKPIISDFGRKLYEPYSKYPAATSVHHAFPGGLLNHTFQMLNMLDGLYPTLPYAIKIERCILAILFHDYGKVYEYSKDGEPQEAMYLMGHIYISAHTLQNTLENAEKLYGAAVDRKEISRIVHCVLAHHGEKDYGSPVVPCMQEAVIVNLLDNLSAKTDTIEGAGEMEMCGPLGTHIIK